MNVPQLLFDEDLVGLQRQLLVKAVRCEWIGQVDPLVDGTKLAFELQTLFVSNVFKYVRNVARKRPFRTRKRPFRTRKRPFRAHVHTTCVKQGGTP